METEQVVTAAGDTRGRILEAALEVLGRDADAGVGAIASRAGVVRRTFYGYFPSRADLVRTLTERAADEVAAVLDEVDVPDRPADLVWADFLARLWPLARRYRLLVSLRRGEYGEEIHAVLRTVENSLAAVVNRGQNAGRFGRHLPADVLSQLAWSTTFAIAHRDLTDGLRAATMSTLLLLGVPEARASALAAAG